MPSASATLPTPPKAAMAACFPERCACEMSMRRQCKRYLRLIATGVCKNYDFRRSRRAAMTTGQRIKWARKRAKKTQIDLAKACGVDRGTVSQWESSKIKNVAPEHMRIIARETQTDLQWLTYGIGSPDKGDDDIIQMVPLIEWEEAEQYSREGAQDSGVSRRYMDAHMRLGPNAYALTVTADDNFNPAAGDGLPPGAVIVVDPEAEPEPGRIVIVHEPGARLPHAGKLVERGAKQYIEPLNPRYDASPLEKDTTVLGSVRRMRLDRTYD
ncbi:MAG TPA: helix-turn-helix domain-containing protein [Gammaproteobacteria bacterium]|nr:helix-turn-helix domain-containing protein [Gammaproteobacteria bacterium]